MAMGLQSGALIPISRATATWPTALGLLFLFFTRKGSAPGYFFLICTLLSLFTLMLMLVYDIFRETLKFAQIDFSMKFSSRQP